MIRRLHLNRITEAGMFFERTGPVWDTLHALETRLGEAGIDYVIIGGLALNAHNYARQTVDIDVVVTPDGFASFGERFAGSLYQPGTGAPRRFADPETDVTIGFLIAGERAGLRSKNPSVSFPDPREGEVHGDLRTVSLARLVELKLVTWRFKDWGDVVELIRANHLPESFADRLDSVVHSAYLQCWDQANDPGYEGR